MEVKQSKRSKLRNENCIPMDTYLHLCVGTYTFAQLVIPMYTYEYLCAYWENRDSIGNQVSADVNLIIPNICTSKKVGI